jgi:large subunit ribosomal protein L12
MEAKKMEYIYTAMLLHKAGKEITEETVKAVLSGAGVSVDDARVKALVAALQGVDIEEAIKKAAVSAAPAIAAPTTGGAAPADEAKKEEKSKEDEKKAEASAAAGLGALFG